MTTTALCFETDKLEKLIKENITLIKQVARVNNLLEKQDSKENIVEILVLKEKLALKFNNEVNIGSQKNKIMKKLEKIETQRKRLNDKLQNKAYLKNAPKEIVQNDKDLLKDLIIEDNKLRSIVSSID